MYKKGDTIWLSELNKVMDDVRDKLLKMKPKQEGIKDGQTVLFDNFSHVGRTQFKKDYPTNKITHKISEADVIIVPEHMQYNTVSYVPMFYEELKPGQYRWNRTSMEKIVVTQKHMPTIHKLNQHMAIVNSDKPMILDSFVNIKSHYGRKMDENEKKKIGELLSANDVEMRQLGLNLLLAFEYESNEEEYVLTLAQHVGWLSKGRVMKTLVKKIKSKYRNLNI